MQHRMEVRESYEAIDDGKQDESALSDTCIGVTSYGSIKP